MRRGALTSQGGCGNKLKLALGDRVVKRPKRGGCAVGGVNRASSRTRDDRGGACSVRCGHITGEIKKVVWLVGVEHMCRVGVVGKGAQELLAGRFTMSLLVTFSGLF